MGTNESDPARVWFRLADCVHHWLRKSLSGPNVEAPCDWRHRRKEHVGQVQSFGPACRPRGGPLPSSFGHSRSEPFNSDPEADDPSGAGVTLTKSGSR